MPQPIPQQAPQPPHPQVTPPLRPQLGLEYLKQFCVFWGGDINFRSESVELMNTCPFDNLLMGICIIPDLQPNFFRNLPQVPGNVALTEIIRYVHQIDRQVPNNWERQWNLAKEKYVNEIMDPDFRPQLRRERNNYLIDFFGSEYSKIIVHLRNFFTHNPRRNCSLGCQLDGLIDNSRQEHSIFLIKDLNNHLHIQTEWRGQCQSCGSQFDTIPYFGQNQPNFIIIQANARNIQYHEAPDSVIIDNRNFKLLCVTIKIESRAHFISIFRLNNINYYVDGIGRKVKTLPPFDPRILNKRNIEGYEKYYKLFISSALYYLN